MLLFSLATLLLNGWLIGSLMLYSRMPPAPTAKLRVISLNVLTSNPDKSKVMRYLRESGADIIFLIEVNVAWSRATEVLKAAYPYGTAQTREDNFGIILLSRIPLTNVSIFTIGDADLPSVEAHVRTEKQEWVIIGTHPLPPMGAFYAHQRDVHLAQIASHVEKLNLPVLAVGDLNATPWSEGMRVLTKGSRLRLAPDSWRPTWQVGTPLAIPIDHALCCGVLQILSKRIGPDVGSDHRPIELEIGLVE